MRFGTSRNSMPIGANGLCQKKPREFSIWKDLLNLSKLL